MTVRTFFVSAFRACGWWRLRRVSVGIRDHTGCECSGITRSRRCLLALFSRRGIGGLAGRSSQSRSLFFSINCAGPGRICCCCFPCCHKLPPFAEEIEVLSLMKIKEGKRETWKAKKRFRKIFVFELKIHGVIKFKCFLLFRRFRWLGHVLGWLGLLCSVDCRLSRTRRPSRVWRHNFCNSRRAPCDDLSTLLGLGPRCLFFFFFH